MTTFLLDTNICVALIRGKAPRVFDRLRKLPTDSAAISSITLAELQFGVAKSARPQHNAQFLAQFCAPLSIPPFDNPAAEIYGDIRAHLETAGTTIGPLDTLIAAHALALNVILVTNNEREFQRVPNLKIENWLK